MSTFPQFRHSRRQNRSHVSKAAGSALCSCHVEFGGSRYHSSLSAQAVQVMYKQKQACKQTSHMPANAVCKADDAALLVPVPDGAYSVQCPLKTHPVICIKWVAVCTTCKAWEMRSWGGHGVMCVYDMLCHSHPFPEARFASTYPHRHGLLYTMLLLLYLCEVVSYKAWLHHSGHAAADC